MKFIYWIYHTVIHVGNFENYIFKLLVIEERGNYNAKTCLIILNIFAFF
jgi:hypothetical protein